MHLSPCDMAAKERLFNGTVAWKKLVAQELNANGQVPIFSSINKWNSTPSQASCPRNEQQVTQEMAGLSCKMFLGLIELALSAYLKSMLQTAGSMKVGAALATP